MVSLDNNNLTVFGCSMTLFGLLLSSGSLTYFFRMGSRTTTIEKTSHENQHAIDELTANQQTLIQKVQDTSFVAVDAQNRVARVEPDVHALQMTQAQQQVVIDEIRRQMSKLDRVDEISAHVAAMRETVSDVMKNALVPRPELNRQFENDGKRFERVEQDVRDLMKNSKGED